VSYPFLAGTVLLLTAVAPASRAGEGVFAVVLGVVQDGGMPHIGCRQEICAEAFRDPRKRQRVASLGLVDEARRFLIDATPDFPSQIESLNAGLEAPPRPVDGILLTHAHIGHYAGLMYLGREALGAKGIPVYATARMARFLRDNAPWSQLVALGNIELREIEPDREFSLTPHMKVTPIRVPHRDELSDTVAYRIQGPARSLLYLPDIDRWERWERKVEVEVAGVDNALLDGTFESETEVPGRSLAEIPHPMVKQTVARLRGDALKGRVFFIHLNHTNRLLWDGLAREDLLAQGFGVARDGQEFPLGLPR
jgi:pyrroloquinoline quinone biosynthesis protein B